MNKLIDFYNQDAVNDKKVVSINTRNFINDRILVLNKELDSLENLIMEFKKNKKFVDLNIETERDIISNYENKNRYVLINSELAIRKLMLDRIQLNEKELEIIDVNLGGFDDNIDNSVSEHNKLIFERQEVLKTATELHPKAKSLKTKILNNVSA